jgi:alpha-1,2-mannosyltransferase
VVAAVGMMAYLVSPVSWVHHMQWAVVVLGALLGDGRDPRRVAAAAVGTVLFWIRLPWWGANLLAGDSVPNGLARVVQNSYCELAVVALLLLWLLVARGRTTDREAPAAADTLAG